MIEEYHEVKAFLLAQRPAYVRMIGQAPVIGKTVFDMASDAESFQVSIPSKNKYLVGAVAMERTSSKPIENLRPQHLLDALLSTEIRKEEAVLFEEFNDERARYYVLTVVRGGYRTEVLRKIWFDRADLQVARLEEFGPKGILLSDVRYSNWEPVTLDQQHSSATPSGITSFPRVIRIDRPHDDYRLDLQMTKLQLNEAIPPGSLQTRGRARGFGTGSRGRGCNGEAAMMSELIVRNLLHRPLRTLIGVHRRRGRSGPGGVNSWIDIRLADRDGEAHRRHRSGRHAATARRFRLHRNDRRAHAHQNRRINWRNWDTVQAVAPTLLQFSSQGGVDVVYGIDAESFRAVSGGFVFLQGHDMEGADDLLVDNLAAAAKHIKVGDTYKLLNHDWHVAAIIEHGKGARLFVPLATLQDLVGAPDKASIFWLKVRTPRAHGRCYGRDSAPLAGLHGPSSECDVVVDDLDKHSRIAVVHQRDDIPLAVAIGLLVIFLTMYTTVIERTRDIGVLKSLGGGRVFIVRALLTESAGLCLMGIVAGVGLSYAVRAAFLVGFPTLSILITPVWILRAAGIALVGAILGASYPAWMASRKDAVEALSSH